MAKFIGTLTSARRACFPQPCRCASGRTSFLPDKSPALKVTLNRWRWVGSPDKTPRGWHSGQPLIQAPRLSAIGALARYVSNAETKNFQPVNITFALLEPLPEQDRKRVRRKRDRHQLQVELALKEWDTWLQGNTRRVAGASGLRMKGRHLVSRWFTSAGCLVGRSC